MSSAQDPNATGKTGAPPAAHNGAYTGWGISAGFEAAIAYMFGWITGLVVVLTEQEVFYCVFHGFQSIIWSIFWTIILIICIIIDAAVIDWDFAICVVICLVTYIILTLLIMYFAWKNGEDGHCTKIPLIGQLAYAWAQSAFPTRCCTCCCV